MNEDGHMSDDRCF